MFHTGVNGEDHPVWLVNRVQIPQPGSYAHFHWISANSHDPRAPEDVPVECDVDSATHLNLLTNSKEVPGITATR